MISTRRRERCASVLFVVALGLSSLSSVNAFSSSRQHEHAIPHKSLLIPNHPRSTWTTTRLTTDLCHKRRRITLLDAVSQKEDPLFDGRTTATLIGGQSFLIVAAAVAALIFQTPNFGLGRGISFDEEALIQGALYSIPLFVLAFLLDTIEDQYPALQDVTRATQKSVIALLGGTLKPLLALTTSIVLGVVAGVGEEMLFRGVLQYELASRLGGSVLLAVGTSSVVFGALHAVTPLYALLATLASVYFGILYQGYDNLAVPISTHAVYDVGALLWAHWTVTQMSSEERDDIVKWNGPR